MIRCRLEERFLFLRGRARWRGRSPDFGILAIGARGAIQVRGKDGVHPESFLTAAFAM